MSPRSGLGHRAPVCWLLLPFILGLIAGKISPQPLPVLTLLIAAIAAVVVASLVSAARPWIWSLALGAGLATAGTAYYELRRARLPDWEGLPAREAELTVAVGRVFANPSRPEGFSALGRVVSAANHLRDLAGQPVAVSLRLTPAQDRPIRGETIVIVGLLEQLPRRPPDDEFQAYLVDAGINFRLHRGRLVGQAAPASRYARAREAVRRAASAALGRGLDEHPALVGALRGMLLGERNGLTDEQENLYLRSGTMHLFAISGLHIGVIAAGVITLLRIARLPPLGTFLTTTVLLAGYVDLTGALPSAVRAWLMVVCLHGATALRAPGNLVSALAVSALLVLLLDPMQLFGAGFQMSYGIVGALLLWGVPLAERWTRDRLWAGVPAASLRAWQRVAARLWQALQSALAVGAAAALVGTISGVAFFGLFTPAAIVANLPLIPLASLALLAGMASLLCALAAAGPAVVLFNHAGALVLAGMQGLLTGLTALPGVAAPAHFQPAWLGEAALGLLLACMAWGYAGGWDRRRGGYWPPVICVGLVLVLGMRFD